MRMGRSGKSISDTIPLDDIPMCLCCPLTRHTGEGGITSLW